MNRENLDFLYKMFPHHNLSDLDIIIINQTTKDKVITLKKEGLQVINSFEKGLSKSRNLALQIATADWCLIADDDLVYLKDFEKNILKGIQMFSTSGVIIFEAVVSKGISLRKYIKQSTKNLSMYNQFEVASFEMLVHRGAIKNKVFFNDNFGLGSSVFNSGEEQIFMQEVAEQLKLVISFYKGVIVQHPWLSTGREYNKEGRYFTKGGFYAKLFPRKYKKWIFKQLFFDVKQGHIKLNNIFKHYKEALLGVQKLKEITNEKYK